jgi:hypothetical protein
LLEEQNEEGQSLSLGDDLNGLHQLWFLGNIIWE